MDYMDYYSLTNPEGIKGWIGLVGWPTVDTLPTQWSHDNYRSGVDQGKSAKDWATPPTNGQQSQVKERLNMSPQNVCVQKTFKTSKLPDRKKIRKHLRTNYSREVCTTVYKKLTLQLYDRNWTEHSQFGLSYWSSPRTVGDRAFRAAAAKTWNSLPSKVTSAAILSTF